MPELAQPLFIEVSEFVVSEHSTRVTLTEWGAYLRLINDYSPKLDGRPLVFFRKLKRGVSFLSLALGLDGNAYLLFSTRERAKTKKNIQKTESMAKTPDSVGQETE